MVPDSFLLIRQFEPDGRVLGPNGDQPPFQRFHDLLGFLVTYHEVINRVVSLGSADSIWESAENNRHRTRGCDVVPRFKTF